VRAAVAAALVVATAGPVAAQTRLVEPPPAPDFLTRTDFHLGASALGSGDERFAWDTHWGGEFDFVDYVKGRVTFYGDYQAVLGHELQPFDPNQGNYTLTVSSSLRFGSGEAAIVFNHLSRHLGDRPKTFGIAMNTLGVRWLGEVTIRDIRVAIRTDAAAVIQNAYIDHSWIAGGEIRAHQPLNDRIDAFLKLNGELVGVDASIAGRDTQQGGGIEGGLRLAGGAGVLELFMGYQRVVDADPIDRQTRHWAVGGFRILTR